MKNKKSKKNLQKALNVSAEQRAIEAAIELEAKQAKKVTTAPKAEVEHKVVIAKEGETGSQLRKRVIVAQTSEKAAKVNPELKDKVNSAKEATKETPKGVMAAIAKAKAAKADKAVKEGKTVKAKKADNAGKYINSITSMEKLGEFCHAQGWKEDSKETIAAYVAGYGLKGVTDMKFITPRIAIYMNIARKRAAKTPAVLDKKEQAVKKEEKVEAKTSKK